MSSLLRVLHAKNLVQSITKRGAQISTSSNHKYMLFYKTQRYFSADIEQIVVPNLGDSITEGTVTSIYKQIGDKVETDEVVLEIETDKVSVDIRAPKNGYIAKYFAEIDQDVEVGGPLYALSIDPIDGIDSSSIKPQESIQKTDIPSPSISTPIPSQSQSIPSSIPTISILHRVPMIKFRYGIREEIDKIIHGISAPIVNGGDNGDDSIPFWELPQEFKRMEWKEQDIEAVNTGGANLAEMRKSNYD